MASYKTPGVYIEEITKFPPSVAQVETAIPAFIGYTEVAKKKIAGDLTNVPTRITSMLEYQTYFGSAEPEEGISVTVSGQDVLGVTQATRSKYLMYYSMQLYFANGGGPCYIVSVGGYSPAGVVFGDLTGGLDEVRKYDEPTLLLFPDATSLLSASDFYSLYNDALMQCADLQDRFTIIDTFTDLSDLSSITELRTGINLQNDYLKYGAAYFPYLNTILDFQYKDIDVEVTGASGVTVGEEAEALMNTISSASLQTLLTTLVDDIFTDIATETVANSKVSIRANIQSAVQYLTNLKSTTDSILTLARAETDPSIDTPANNLDTWITNKIEQTLVLLAARLDVLNAITNVNSGANRTALTELVNDVTDSLYSAYGLDPLSIPTATILVDINTAVAASGTIKVLVQALLDLTPGGSSITNLAAIAISDNLLYNKIKAEISLVPVKLPPSSAMAGIYARIDSLKGVWKAPANVGVTYVTSPSVVVTHDEQADMNVTTTGKSVNAIRSFTGKGTLVWGARTLAGNDNEWRYISVRRFFNMVEESVKKATDQFVFEGNDANTWVRLRAMIENFLTLQWRAGALTGAKPEQAFYVRIGLGQTMTADDILNGYMNIEIGMAVVRPAEFIVLKFSHKMQEA